MVQKKVIMHLCINSNENKRIKKHIFCVKISIVSQAAFFGNRHIIIVLEKGSYMVLKRNSVGQYFCFFGKTKRNEKTADVDRGI